MDEFDDFEVKPLTQGLGFHRKPSKLKDQVRQSGLVEDSLRSIPNLPPDELLSEPKTRSAREIIDEMLLSVEKPIEETSDVTITETLPKSEDSLKAFDFEIEVPEVSEPETPEAPTQDEDSVNVAKVFPETNLDFLDSGVRRGAHDSPARNLKPASVSIASAILDGMVVLAMSLIFLVSLVLVTSVDLFSIIGSAKNDVATQLSMFVLYIAVLQMYVIVARCFFGKTLGEWTFDLQMGDNDQQEKSSYPALIFWRSLIVTLTGLVILPILSLLFRKDIASYLTGLQLYRKTN